MHPWHDCYVDDALVEAAFPVIIEVPKGSTNKYELDKETGLLRLDRVLYSAVYYPADYGFIPRTYCDDGDPLDALVLSEEPVHPLTIVEARAIGVMRMRDEKGIDDKIVAVSVRDPAYCALRRQGPAAAAHVPADSAVLRGLQGARAQAGRRRRPARRAPTRFGSSARRWISTASSAAASSRNHSARRQPTTSLNRPSTGLRTANPELLKP